MEPLRVTLTPQERDLLVVLLTEAVADKHAELRRTESGSFREDLRQQEKILRGLLEKLQQPVA
jgi:hypothetical protein